MTVQLHLAAYRLMFDYTETARLARDLAVMLEEHRDAELGDRWETPLAAVRRDFNAEHPEAPKRLGDLMVWKATFQVLPSAFS